MNGALKTILSILLALVIAGLVYLIVIQNTGDRGGGDAGQPGHITDVCHRASSFLQRRPETKRYTGKHCIISGITLIIDEETWCVKLFMKQKCFCYVIIN